jgi:hypothetical protein
VSVMSHGCISLPVIFGMAESFRMESVLFDIAEVSLPFNAILGRLVHYGYLVLKMPSPLASSGSGETVTQGLCAGEAPASSSGSQSCCRAWGPGPRATKLAPERLGLSTQRATLCQGRCPHQDYPGQG